LKEDESEDDEYWLKVYKSNEYWDWEDDDPDDPRLHRLSDWLEDRGREIIKRDREKEKAEREEEWLDFAIRDSKGDARYGEAPWEDDDPNWERLKAGLARRRAKEWEGLGAAWLNIQIDAKQKVFLSDKKFDKINLVRQHDGPWEKTVGDESFLKYKPEGLWYACGSEWIEYLRDDAPHWLESVHYLYEITTSNKIKYITDASQFEEFEDNYVTSHETAREGYFETYINWEKLQDDGFAGIEICPYLREKRSKAWYHGFDIASGCIWDPSGLKSFKLLASREEEDSSE